MVRVRGVANTRHPVIKNMLAASQLTEFHVGRLSPLPTLGNDQSVLPPSDAIAAFHITFLSEIGLCLYVPFIDHNECPDLEVLT